MKSTVLIINIELNWLYYCVDDNAGDIVCLIFSFYIYNEKFCNIKNITVPAFKLTVIRFLYENFYVFMY